jgi:putative spermidine/putrescine transport system substrate-binding protein
MSSDARSARWAWLAVAGLSVFIAAFAIGCGSSDSSDSTSGGGEMLSEVGKGEGELNLICWAGYCEDGSTDPKVDWISDFEKQTGCQVNVKIGNTSDEMVTLMRTGDYDGVSASGDATLRLIDGGDVAPVNTDLVSNYADVFPGLKDQPYNSVDGQMYGIPHGRGANLLMSNTDVVKPAADSWGAVFDQKQMEANKGKITAYDSPIYIADAALYLMATQPDLGITNPYELDEDQFNAAVDLLKTQNDYIGEYWSDYTKEIQAFTNGNSVVGTTWQVINQLLQADNQPVDAVYPKEGSTGWSDTWMISSEAEHPNCMYMWMNHIIDPKTNAAVAEWFGEAPANEKACGFTADPNHCKIYDADGKQYLDEVYYWTTPVSDCGDDRGDVCKTYDDWNQAWTEIKG